MDDSFSDDSLNIDERENEVSQRGTTKNGRTQALDGNTDHALLSFTQRSQRPNTSSADGDETLKPRNNFEKFLKSIGVQIKVDSAYKKYFYIDGNRSHPTLVFELEGKLKNKKTCEDVITWLSEAAGDQEILQLYITPMKSACGNQDTIIRALLLCTHSQAKVFEILLCSMQRLAKSESDDLLKLATVCVAQIRYLDFVVDSRALFQSIFDRDVEDWMPSPRDALIEAIPEVLIDPMSQQEATAILLEFMVKSPNKSPVSFRSACISALKFLKFNATSAIRVRKVLCTYIMEFSAIQMPEVVSLVLHSLKADEKPSLKGALAQIASNLKIDDLRVDREYRKTISIDDVVLDLFSRICRFIQMDGAKNWKEVMAFLKSSDDKTREESSPSPTDDNDEEQSDKMFGLFDILLSFALLSLDSCPSSIVDNIKRQLKEGRDRVDHFVTLCGVALQYRKFCVQHCSSLTNVARQCLWTDHDGVRRFGAVVYKQLFISVEKTRETIFPEMMSHMEKSDEEAEAILVCLEELLVTHMDILATFISEIYKCLDTLSHLSVPNIKRLFKVLITMLSNTDDQQLKTDFDESILKFVTSVNEKEQLWGLLGNLMQLESSIQFKSGSAREKAISSQIAQLEGCCAKSVWLKSVFYEQLSIIIRSNIRETKSTFLLKWAEKLLTTFRNDFFITRPANYETNSDLEGHKYTRNDVHLWLSPPRERLSELVPLFELLKEVSLLKQRWATEDDTQEAVSHHWTEFVFILEANIDMCDVSTELNLSEDVMKTNASKLYYVVDWIRAVLNTFSMKNSIDGVDGTLLSDLWIKKFNLLFECQKQLIYMVKLLKRWLIPSLSVQSAHILITSEVAKAGGKKPTRARATKRKRKAANDQEEASEPANDAYEEDTVPDCDGDAADETAVDTRKAITLSNLLDHLRQMKLSSVVRLICLLPSKRRATAFLVEELLKIFKVVLPPATRKVLPFALKTSCRDSTIHGDAALVWKLTLKAVPVVWGILNTTADYFRADLNCSDVSDKDPELITQLADMMRTSLALFSSVLSCKEVCMTGDITENVRRSRISKRCNLMEKLEHTIIQNRESQEDAAEDAEYTFLKYLVNCAEIAPNIEVAVALLQTMKSSTAWNDELRKRMARQTLHFLKKDWKDAEGLPLKATTLNSSVRILLEHFIGLREEKDRLGTIQWLLANKVAELVPDDERRKSKITTYQDSQDQFFNQADRNSSFLSFTKGSFAGIYKVLFTFLNNTIQARLSHSDSLHAGLVSADEVLEEWKMAANSFCLLGLMLRVPLLRSSSVLLVAAKEGKRFLTLSSQKTSFIYVIEDHARFSSATTEINAIIKSVQLGNRTLQNISVYAKAMKSPTLLKALPELRASSELWMRAIHWAIVNVGGREAFQIGLLKSRDINGEEIHDNEEDDDEPVSSEAVTAHNDVEMADADEEETSAVY